MFLQDVVFSMEKRGGNNSFCIGDVFYSYAFLFDRIKAIMRLISAEPRINKSTRVAIVCDDSIDTYASILALWFSGKAYVPLGLHNPVDRNLTILAEAQIDCIFSTLDLKDDRYRDFLIANPAASPSGDKNFLFEPRFDGGVAYILFTSGSTGIPKGVPITFDNVSAFSTAFSAAFGIQENDQCLQMFELTFDVSVSSFLIPLMKGACVYTVPNNVIKYVHVLKLIEKYKLTSIQIVPSVIKLARPLLSRITFPSVLNCILTGEATAIDLIPIWKKCIPNASVFNFYGPTETTIYCSTYACAVDPVKSYNSMLAIGKPLSGISFLIVDDQFNSVSKGTKGELLIAGPQNTKGYLNNPEKNASAFVKLKLDGAETVFYRSGDLCYEDETGEFFYCGRIDNQVKIQGFRVELSEIEMVVTEMIRTNNVVVVGNGKDGTVELILVLETPTDINSKDIIEKISQRLPSYMVPLKVSKLDSFPLTSSGKTDRPKIKGLLNEKL